MPTVYQLVAQVLVRTVGEDGATFDQIISFVRDHVPHQDNLESLVRAALDHGVKIGLLKATDPFVWMEERYCLSQRAGAIFNNDLVASFFN